MSVYKLLLGYTSIQPNDSDDDHNPSMQVDCIHYLYVN